MLCTFNVNKPPIVFFLLIEIVLRKKIAVARAASHRDVSAENGTVSTRSFYPLAQVTTNYNLHYFVSLNIVTV